MRKKLAAITFLPKGRQALAYSHGLCFTKTDVSRSWCYSHLSVFLSCAVLFLLWLPTAKIGGQSKSCFQTIEGCSLSQMSDDECDSLSGSCVQGESLSDHGADKQRWTDETFSGSSSSWECGLWFLAIPPSSAGFIYIKDDIIIFFLGLLDQLGLG